MQLFHGGQSAKLAQAPVGARGQVHARRIGAVHDVEVVIAGQDQQALGDRWMRGHRVEKLSPFGRAAGVGHVASDQNKIERRLGVQRLKLFQ